MFKISRFRRKDKREKNAEVRSAVYTSKFFFDFINFFCSKISLVVLLIPNMGIFCFSNFSLGLGLSEVIHVYLSINVSRSRYW